MAEASQSRLGITRAKISQNLSHSNMNVVKSLRRSLRRSKKTRDKSTESSRSKSADRLDISGNGNASSAYNKDGDEEEEEIGVVRRERQKEEQLKQVAEATPAQPNNNNNVEVVQFGNGNLKYRPSNVLLRGKQFHRLVFGKLETATDCKLASIFPQTFSVVSEKVSLVSTVHLNRKKRH